MVAHIKVNHKNDPQRIVLKIGSSLIVNQDGNANITWLHTLAKDIARRHKAGQNIIIVSSGAVALGAQKLGIAGRENLTNSQACAAVGQIILAGLWTDILNTEGLIAAQTLLTLDDLEERRRYLNISSTLEKLIQTGTIPIINENDSVATHEIRYGDNDRLAARVAQASHAQQLILLSDIDGLYDRDPSDQDAKIIKDIYNIDDDIRRIAQSSSTSGIGSGGMASKIEAAQTAMSSGIDMIIASGKKDYPLSAIAAGRIHSFFHKHSEISADKGQKKWLNGRLHAQGTITIDEGAKIALEQGASLLAIGVTSVKGIFKRGDVVEILDGNNSILARGLSEYDSNETILIIGKNKHEINEILSYPPRSALVHRSHMVLL